MFVLLYVYNIVHLVGSNKLIYISSVFIAVQVIIFSFNLVMILILMQTDFAF